MTSTLSPDAKPFVPKNFVPPIYSRPTYKPVPTILQTIYPRKDKAPLTIKVPATPENYPDPPMSYEELTKRACRIAISD